MSDHSKIRELEQKLQETTQKLDQFQTRFDSFKITAGRGVTISGAGANQSVNILDPTISFSLDCETLTGTGTINW